MKNVYINTVIILLLLIITAPSIVLAVEAGPRSGSTFSTVAYTGSSTNWANPSGAALPSDNSIVTATISNGSPGNRYTNYLRATGFGFTIPNNAVINGILVEVKLSGPNANSSDKSIRILKNGAVVGNDLAQPNIAWPTSSAYRSYGSSTNLWGATWTAADINASNFGFQIAAGKISTQSANPRIDHIRITVFYNEQNFYSKPTGDLNVLATWGTNLDGTGTAPTSFTADGQNFRIVNNNPGTINNNWTVSGAGSKVVVGNGTTAQTFTIPAAYEYTGLVDVTNNGTLDILNTVNPTLNVLHSGSTVNYAFPGSQLIESANYYNLVLSGSGTKSLEAGPVITTVTNDFTINADVDFFNSSDTLQLLGNLIISGIHTGTGAIWLSGSGTQDISGTNGSLGNLIIESSSLNIPAVTLSTPAVLTGTLTLTSGTFQVSSNLITDPGSVILIENGALSGIPVSTDPYDVIYTDSLTSTGDELLGVGLRDVTIDLINVAGNSSRLTLTNNISLTGNLLITNGELIANTYNISIGGDLTNNGIFTANTSTVNFNGTVSQTISGSSVTQFNNLTISNTLDTVYATSNFNVTNTMTVGSGAVIELQPIVVVNSGTRTGNITGSGTIIVTRSNGVSDYYEQYRFATNNLLNLTLEYNGIAQQAIDQPFNFGHIKINNPSGVIVTSNTTIEGQLSLITGDFIIGSNTLTLNGPPIIGDETNFITNASSSLIFGGSSVGVYIPSGVDILTNLIISNPNWIDLHGNMTVTGTLDLTQNATIFNIGANTLTLNGPITGIGHLAGSITSRLIVNGTSAINADLNFDNSFNNLQSLIINRPVSIVTIHDPVIVNDTLQLLNGALAAGNTLTMGPSSLIIRSGGTLSAITVGANVYDVEYYGNSKLTGDELIGPMLTNIKVELNPIETLTLADDISLLNNFNIEQGIVDVTSSNYDIDLGGNFLNNGTFLARQGSVIFDGTAFQTIGGTTNTDFYSITINNSSGVNLLTDASMFGTLTFITGNLTLGINDLFVGINAMFSGISNANYIITDDKGGVERIVGQTSGELLYPVGTLDSYNPAYLIQGLNGVTDTYKVRVYEDMYDEYTISGEPVGQPYTDFVVRQTWIIDEAVNGGSDITVALQWNGGDEATGFNSNASGVGYYFQQWIGSPTFTPANARPLGLSQKRSDLNLFDNTPYGVGSPGSILPVELISFEGELNGEVVDLSWVTANETNNSLFEVQRSADGTSFETIGEVAGNGTTTQVSEYAFTDIDPLEGVSYYRLKQIDLNGEFEYTQTIKVKVESTFDITIYPVPAVNYVTIDLDIESSNDEITSYELINTLGKVVKKGQIELGSSDLDLSNYPNGNYILILNSGDGVYTKELIISR